jgi:adenylate kinase
VTGLDRGGLTVILIGPPGAGKGTQGALLATAFGWERLVTGDLLRSAIREGTELGKRARAYMDAGDLVPDELMIALVQERLRGFPFDRGVVFDGFPRTVAQADALSVALPSVERSLDAVLLLEAADAVLVKRIGGRRSCPQCGRVYNVYSDPPISDGSCDECGARLDHRKDDHPDTVRHRLKVYADLTEPLMAHYEDRAFPVLRVNGEGSLEQVRTAVVGALTSHLGVEV